MVETETECCVPCGFLGMAVETGGELLAPIGQDLDAVRAQLEAG